MLQKIGLVPLLIVLALPLRAQEKGGNEYIFRFVPGKDMFYVPYSGNEIEIQRLCDSLKVYAQQLNNGQMYINVSSYAASSSGELTAGRMSWLRNNRVKAELIRRAGLKEAMFVTDRIIPYAYGNDRLRNVVVVTFPATVEKVAQIAGEEAAAKVKAYREEISGETERRQRAAEQARRAGEEARKQTEAARRAAEQAAREQAEAARQAQEQAAREQAEAARLAAEAAAQAAKAPPYTWALRANLLNWALLTPGFGAEWRIDRNFSVLVNGSWTSWSRDNKNRKYALWEIVPEVRYYTGRKKRAHVGVMFCTGSFDYKPGSTGKQGDHRGGGITGGYTLGLNRTLSLDFHAALGYTRAVYDKYKVINGVQVRAGSDTKNYWGISQPGVTLVWKFIK